MNLIVAADLHFGIGKDGTLPWHIRADLAYFKQMTLHKTIIMGRRTLQSFPGGRPLPDRTNIVLTADRSFCMPGVEVYHDLESLFSRSLDCAFVVGGASVYAQLLPYCTLAYLTRIERVFDTDTVMPNLDLLAAWVCEDEGKRMEENGITFRFCRYRNQRVRQMQAVSIEQEG